MKTRPAIAFPPELLAKFAANHAKYGDLQMMADEPAGEPQDTDQEQDAPAADSDKDDNGYKGAGSKDALKADLTAERTKRQDLERQFNEFRDGLTKALGLKSDEVTPEQLTQQLQQANQDGAQKDARIAALEQVVNVFTQSPAHADVQALVDSKAFTDKLAADKPTDLKAFVTDYVKDNPRFARGGGTNGDLAAGHGRIPENVTPGVGRLAAAIEQQINKK